MTRQLLILFSVALLSLQGCQQPRPTGLPFYDTPDFTPRWNSKKKGTPAPHTIKPFTFKDQNGHPLSNAKFQNTMYISGFFFSSCNGICPSIIQNLKRVNSALETDQKINILLHSVTPQIDRPGRLKAFEKQHHLDPTYWHLVTGQKDTLYDMARTAYFVEEPEGNKPTALIHTEWVTLIDQNKRIRGLYRATLPRDITHLIADIQTLQKTHLVH
ncbi:MAG: protein SCO1/2 [Candidatus Marinamargulisbacteria bacterium]|jgi:protein SCO1/2